MIVTEKEAAEKWCPMARTAPVKGGEFVLGIPVFNRLIDVVVPDKKLGPNPVASRCIGSRCMAWRFVNIEWEPGEQIWSSGGGSYTTEKPPEPRGYCGAFGKKG